MKKLYLGVVGQIACGKGILVDCLVEKHGFISFSLSTIVHQELKKRNIKNFDRKTLQDVGDDLRKRYGGDVLVKRAIRILNKQTVEGRGLRVDLEGRRSRIEKSPSSSIYPQNPPSIFYHRPSFIIEGIRNTAEVEYLKKKPNFVLIGVKAKRKLRFQRLLQRNKTWDPKTWEEFLIVDRRDLGQGQDKSGQQVGKCLAYCDYILTNNKDVKDFERKVRRLLNKILN